MSHIDAGVLGLDIGAVLTKLVRPGSPPVVRRTPAPAELERFVAGLFGKGGGGVLGVARPAGAVPLPGHFPQAARFVRGVLCAAAVHQYRRQRPAGRRVHIVCDAGARTISAAVCVADGAGVRLVRAVHTASPDAAAALGGSPELATTLVAQRERAALVLDRAATHERYHATPAYRSPEWTVTAGAVRRALAPVADEAGGLVRTLLDGLDQPLDERSDVVLTGVFGALHPVREAVLRGCGGAHPVVLEPSAVAEGAGLVAAGLVAAEEDYAHTVGLAGHRVRHGRLEPTVLTLAQGGQPVADGGRPALVTVPGDGLDVLPIRLRVNGSGPWQPWWAEPGERPPAGVYEASVVPGSASTGVVVLRPEAGGPVLRYPLTEVPEDGEDGVR